MLEQPAGLSQTSLQVTGSEHATSSVDVDNKQHIDNTNIHYRPQSIKLNKKMLAVLFLSEIKDTHTF